MTAGSPWLSCYLSKKLLFPFIFTCTCNTQATNCYYLGLPTFWHWNMMVEMCWISFLAVWRHNLPMGYRLHTTFWLTPAFYSGKPCLLLLQSNSQHRAANGLTCLRMPWFRHVKFLPPYKTLQAQGNWDNYPSPHTHQGPSSVKKTFWMKKSAKGVAHIEVYCEDRTEQWVSTGAAQDGSWALHLPVMWSWIT